MCIKNCHQKDTYLIYYGNEICEKHFGEHCDNLINLKDGLGIKEA